MRRLGLLLKSVLGRNSPVKRMTRVEQMESSMTSVASLLMPANCHRPSKMRAKRMP